MAVCGGSWHRLQAFAFEPSLLSLPDSHNYVVMAYVVMTYVVMAYVVMTYVVMAYVVMAYTAMAWVVMVYTLMVRD